MCNLMGDTLDTGPMFEAWVHGIRNAQQCGLVEEKNTKWCKSRTSCLKIGPDKIWKYAGLRAYVRVFGFLVAL